MAYDNAPSLIDIARITDINAAIDAAWPLLEAHRAELTTHKEIMELAPRRDVYQNLEANDGLFALGLYDAGELVGYSVNIVTANLHYGGLVVCQNDLFFVHRDYRAWWGLRLMNATEKLAKATYAREQPLMQLWHAKPNTPFATILARRGCEVQDVVFSKAIP